MPIELDDVFFNKAGIMERCLRRVFEEAVSRERIGVPQTSADSFEFLRQRGLFAAELGLRVEP